MGILLLGAESWESVLDTTFCRSVDTPVFLRFV